MVNFHSYKDILLTQPPKITHLEWNLQLIQSESFRQKSLRIIHRAIQSEHTNLESKGVSQRALYVPNNPLLVEGVIYAIVHFPTGRMYVGQTIKNSHTRFLQHLWTV